MRFEKKLIDVRICGAGGPPKWKCPADSGYMTHGEGRGPEAQGCDGFS